MASLFQKAEIELELLWYKKELELECHTIHRYGTANNKYMNNYNKDNKSSCIVYLDCLNANNLHV